MASDRRVTTAFNLITAEGVTKYVVGDVISGEVAEHWYAQAHSVDPSEEAVESADEASAGNAVQNAESDAPARKK